MEATHSGSIPSSVPGLSQECEHIVPDPYLRVDGQNYKALLIGICAGATATSDCPQLKGSHKDVGDVRDLLIDCYGYLAADITILIDDGIPGHVQPTRDNILKAIHDLVKDAKAGDHFCFHYCGHSTQVKNRSNSEEDGMDECLVPSDGVDKLIVDNELNASLVVPLPAGSQLVAVLDTCHSGSLLDLRHNRCNRVLVPWKWRGRRGSEEMRHNVVRNNARMVSARVASILPGRKATPLSPTSSTRLLARRSEINMNLVCRPPPSRTGSGAPAPEASDRAGRGPGPQRIFTYRSRTVSFAEAAKENDGGVHSHTGEDGGEVPSALTGKIWVLPEEAKRCESPDAMFACTGWCRDADKYAAETDPSSDKVKADVISLASCKDSQTTYEDEDGKSMTSSLVEILRRDPNQSLKDVLVYISHAMYTKAVIRHDNAKKYKKDQKEYMAKLEKHNAQNHRTMSLVVPEPPPSPLPSRTFPVPVKSSFTKKIDSLKLKKLVFELTCNKKRDGYDMDSFQNPELASPRPLDMQRQWRM
ncbi:caspase domain-containing protein [Mycena maculata]|uniref:Caspase domain-containing protein n=1 Tax=Mycena maculata TaxID=230809 RepID=A0AAD7NKP8_9AGAR|nr:caspase domain-containing protein [Mycena maculata]